MVSPLSQNSDVHSSSELDTQEKLGRNSNEQGTGLQQRDKLIADLKAGFGSVIRKKRFLANFFQSAEERIQYRIDSLSDRPPLSVRLIDSWFYEGVLIFLAIALWELAKKIYKLLPKPRKERSAIFESLIANNRIRTRTRNN